MRSHRGLLSALLLLALAPGLPAQTSASEAAAKYSDKDKKKLAEIAQRPEVKDRIQAEWDKIRRGDMNLAYRVNTSGSVQASWQLAELRNDYGQLYNNPMLQRYLNDLGQRIVPRDSANLYAFRLLLDPQPRAEALSTGTIYVSTGLVSLLDNEAQLSYVLAHEIAHVERNHMYNRLRDEILDDELQKEKSIEAEKKRAGMALFGAIAGAAIGGAAGGGSWAALGSMAGAGLGYGIGTAAFRNRFEPTEWAKVFEDEADAEGVRLMLDQNYDAREIPRLYTRLDNLVARDRRLGLGFVGSPHRVRERTAHIQNLLTGTYRPVLEQRMSAGGLKGAGGDFSLLMSALKRDNGIVALEYDLFAMAKDNLMEAAALRSSDASVHHYLGRTLVQTGRTAEEKQQAMNEFLLAMKYDAQRGAYPDPHLEYALFVQAQNPTAQAEIQRELKTYVVLYQREHAGALPQNMPIIYDYLSLAGNAEWYAPPAAVISTKNVDAVYVTPVAAAPATAGSEVIRRAAGLTEETPTLLPGVEVKTPSPPVVKRASQPRKPN